MPEMAHERAAIRSGGGVTSTKKKKKKKARCTGLEASWGSDIRRREVFGNGGTTHAAAERDPQSTAGAHRHEIWGEAFGTKSVLPRRERGRPPSAPTA